MRNTDSDTTIMQTLRTAQRKVEKTMLGITGGTGIHSRAYAFVGRDTT